MSGLKDPSGLRFALRHLVRETYLRSGGDRGFPLEKGVQLLAGAREDLNNFDIKQSPIEIIDTLSRAGIMRRNADYCRFLHDSFESYFGARALLVDFQARQYSLIKECHGNERVKESYDLFLHMLDPVEEVPRLQAIFTN